MIKDIDTVKEQTIEADICIIGTGAAGIALGIELENSGKKVVILEAGAMKKTEINQSFYELESTNLSVDVNSRVRTFGGTTTAWGGGWRPLDAIDFERRDWVPFSGWPINRNVLEPYYDRGAKLFGGPTLMKFEKNNIKSVLDTKNIKTGLLRVLPPEKWNFAKNYQKFFESSSNTEILFNAPVVKIVLENNKINMVVVQTLLGRVLKIKAKQYIVACGGIENARLLLVSDIGNKYEQVGRYYMDHPKLVSGSLILNKRDLDLSLYWKEQDINGLVIASFQLTDARQRDLRVLNSCIRLVPYYASDKYPFGTLKGLRTILRFITGVSEIRIRNFIEQAPTPTNRIVLSSKRDMLGNPLAKVEWSLSQIDKQSLAVLHLVLKKELIKNDIGNLLGPIIDNKESFKSVRDASHHMGTTRMGNDPKYSVVDENCKVHEVENLFIAGSSVFPTSGNANPTATIIALAIRLADYLKY